MDTRGIGGHVRTQEEIRRARQADLALYLEIQDWPLKREGNNYRVEGYAGLIVQGNHWYHHSTGQGGNALDFLVTYCGVRFPEAVDTLVALEASTAGSSTGAFTHLRAGEHVGEKHPQSEDFTVPPRSASMKEVLDYLTRTRRLPPEIVLQSVDSGFLYQDTRGNAVFICKDKSGRARGAVLRGTRDGKPFKGMAKGSDGRYGWLWRPDPQRTFKGVAVTEAPIDAISLEALYSGFGCRHILALNGLKKSALLTYLEEYPDTTNVFLGLDNDEPGEAAAREMEREIQGHFQVTIVPPPAGAKDWNEFLTLLSNTNSP